MPSQPNIVFIHAESMDGRKMGCMGHPAMQNATPNMDRLASDGVLFTNAYTNCPVCNPRGRVCGAENIPIITIAGTIMKGCERMCPRTKILMKARATRPLL